MSWIILGLLSAVFASLVAIFGKMGLTSLDSTFATAVRSVIMAVFMIIFSLSLGKLSWPALSALGGKEWLILGAAGIAGALSWLAYFAALKLGPATSVAALDRLSIVFVVVFAILALGERFTWEKALGAVLVALGAFLITLK